MAREGGLRGRVAAGNPPNRFERLRYQPAPDSARPADAAAPRTELLRDDSRSIISTNESPDVGFEATLNPYRGCEHGCVYCYARPTHEYLGFSAGLDFETKILVKERAPALLEEALASP
ncbi:MAG: radical SAM protein, partial [bacterium]